LPTSQYVWDALFRDASESTLGHSLPSLVQQNKRTFSGDIIILEKLLHFLI
jgi:hypothetical protein